MKNALSLLMVILAGGQVPAGMKIVKKRPPDPFVVEHLAKIVSGKDLDCSISAMQLARMGTKAKQALPALMKKARERRSGQQAPACPSAAAHAVTIIAPENSAEFKEAKRLQQTNWE